MEIIRTKNSDLEINVLFTGKRYVFINGFFGLMAIAERQSESWEDRQVFNIECARSIDTGLIKRFIARQENKYCKRIVHFDKIDFRIGSDSLPYGLDIEIIK